MKSKSVQTKNRNAAQGGQGFGTKMSVIYTTKKGEQLSIKQRIARLDTMPEEYWAYNNRLNLESSLDDARWMETSEKELFMPRSMELDVQHYAPKRIRNYVGITHSFHYGCWVIRVIKREDRFDYDIGTVINEDDRYLYHPAALEELITRDCGRTIYKRWKSFVMSQFHQAMDVLLPAVQDTLRQDLVSLLCCERSRNLLSKRPEFTVIGMNAFLLLPS